MASEEPPGSVSPWRVGSRLHTVLTEALAPRTGLGGVMDASGTSATFAAIDRALGVEVVVKAATGPSAASLESDSRALARLGGHPNVLGALTVGHVTVGEPPEPLAWLVTRAATGGSLAARTGVGSSTALSWAGQLAGALAYVHSHGVVHGDVTPTNVLLGPRGEVLLGDFGSAAVLGDAGGPARHFGYTPAFAAPERTRFDPPAPESDVYGLAATILAVCGDPRGIPAATGRLFRRCLGAPRRRPSSPELARRLAGRPSEDRGAHG